MKGFLRIAIVLAIGAVGILTAQAVMNGPDTEATAESGGSGAANGPRDSGAGDAAGGTGGGEAADGAAGAAGADGAAGEGAASGAAGKGATKDAEPGAAAGSEAPSADEPASAAPADDPVSAEAKAAILLVNKEYPLEKEYEPDDLVVPDVPFSFSGEDQKKQLRREAAEALEELFAAAEEDGIELRAVSGYRSYARQKSIFEYNARMKGEKEANRTSARPGESEHQSGLAMDVSAASVNYALEETFGETIEGIWLAEHAAEHGFIIRYPKDKEDITGYKYEPWHLRYVGVEVAAFITERKLTLEEYLLGE